MPVLQVSLVLPSCSVDSPPWVGALSDRNRDASNTRILPQIYFAVVVAGESVRVQASHIGASVFAEDNSLGPYSVLRSVSENGIVGVANRTRNSPLDHRSNLSKLR